MRERVCVYVYVCVCERERVYGCVCEYKVSCIINAVCYVLGKHRNTMIIDSYKFLVK